MRSNPAINAIWHLWNDNDPWGSGVTMLCVVGDVSTAVNDGPPDPAGWWSDPPGPYRTSVENMALDPDDAGVESMRLAQKVVAGVVTTKDLRKALRILSLYLGLLEAAGKDSS